MKIVDKLLKEQKFQFPHPMDIVADLAFKAGYQAAIDQLNTCNKDKLFIRVASTEDFINHLEREVEE